MTKKTYTRSGVLFTHSYTDPSGMEWQPYFTENQLKELLPIRPPEKEHHQEGVQEQNTSSEDLETLLTEAEHSPRETFTQLLQYKDDPRVMPVLLQATKKVPPLSIPNIAQDLSYSSESENILLLEAFLQRFTHEEIFKDDEFVNYNASSQATVAQYLLAQKPASTKAAEILISLLSHPCERNREHTVTHCVDLLKRKLKAHPQTEALLRLRKALSDFASNATDDMFPLLLLFFFDEDREEMKKRCMQIAAKGPEKAKRNLYLHIRALVPQFDQGLKQILFTWFATEQWLRWKVEVAHMLGKDLGIQELTSVCRQALADESPTLRARAIELFEYIDENSVVSLAKEALQDEPEPILREVLESYKTSKLRNHPTATER